MPMTFSQDAVTCTGIIGVEEAEQLLTETLNWTAPTADLSGCAHLHPAALQVLLACGATVTAWPTDPWLARWLSTVLVHHAESSASPQPVPSA
jgi:hypothetical protein